MFIVTGEFSSRFFYLVLTKRILPLKSEQGHYAAWERNDFLIKVNGRWIFSQESETGFFIMTHALKTWPEYFKAIASGDKTFELRKDDRPFSKGDTILLQEYDIDKKEYSGQEMQKTITFILRGDAAKTFGLRHGYCLISFKDKVNE